MIFVTVGTHEQPFDRLIRCIDELKAERVILDDVLIQIGYSTYEPQFCEWKKLLPYNLMKEYIRNARIVITHGGPASFLEVLQEGKTPIVVPRQKCYGEHVNNHQVEFVKTVSERYGTIIPVFDLAKMEETITEYEKLTESLSARMISNSVNFNQKLTKIVEDLLKES